MGDDTAWIERALKEERREHGAVRLPWVAFPDPECHPMDIGWRMGAGESHMMMFHHATKAWSTDDRRALLVAGPVPADWAFWVVDWLDLPGAWDDPESGPYGLAFDHVKEQLNVLGVVVSGRPSEETMATKITDHPIHLGLRPASGTPSTSIRRRPRFLSPPASGPSTRADERDSSMSDDALEHFADVCSAPAMGIGPHSGANGWYGGAPPPRRAVERQLTPACSTTGSRGPRREDRRPRGCGGWS